MNFGTTNSVNGYYPIDLYQAGKSADAADKTAFSNAVAAKMAEKTESVGLKDMWQARFPGAYYHTMDASNIPQGVWDRNDFPFEKFFRNDLDESTINWKPNRANPAMDSSGVQSRLHSIAGQKSIVVPPALEEKMKNDPTLAGHVMAKVESFIAMDEATTPDRISSYLIALDENGEIARFRASSHGGNITGPTEEEMRQFEAEQKAKQERREEYARLNEESALKRKLMERSIERKNIHIDFLNSSVSNTTAPSATLSATENTEN